MVGDPHGKPEHKAGHAGDDRRGAKEGEAPSATVTARTYHTESGVAHAEGETYAVTDRALAETLRGIGFVSIDTWPEDPATAPPALVALTPDTAVLGAPSFTLHVMGSGFTAVSVITFGGHEEPTTLVSDTEVTTGVNMAVWLAPDTVPVTVSNGGAPSAPLLFTFTATRAARGR